MNNSDDKNTRQAQLARGVAFTRAVSDHSKSQEKSSTPTTPINRTVAYIDDELEPITYDYKIVDEFLNTVFHTELNSTENIACYFDAYGQGFPIGEEDFLKRITRTEKPAKLYFGTATVSVDPDRGVILNRIARFERYHVLVLDDIGTKVPKSKIPKDFEPTYIIESSPNNYQYGYVLEEPIESYEQARALVELVYGSGVTDEGGKLVNKKVRLPEGINGKRDSEHRQFRVHLETMDGPYWTPEDILNTLGIAASWDSVVEDANAARKRNTAVVGTSLWSPIRAHHASLDGVIDPIMEWLADNDMIINFDNDWAEIVCPWAVDHTDGKTSAYYSPVGYGDGDHKAYRTYNCFHSHGDTTKTTEFLAFVAENGGPECAPYDPAAALAASHVYDSLNNTIWGIKEMFPRAYKGVEGFKNTFNQSVRRTVINDRGVAELKNTPLGTLFMHSPARVVISGTGFDPRTTARLITEDNVLKLNLFSPPQWGEGPYDVNTVNTFIEFLAYLIPDDTERGIFIEWLAAKVQNMGFRGWGMMMVAKDHGTGRGTLAMMLNRLFDHRNCADRTFKELLNPSNSYNEWQTKLLVISNEASDTSDTKGFYDQCVQLREIIDTTPKYVEINNKYGRIETRLLCTSHLIFTNYENGAALDHDDRRMYVISNAYRPAEPEYFTKLNEWANEQDESGRYVFVNHVARWLKTVPVDLTKMNGRAPFTRAKSDMIAASASALDIFTHAFLAALPTPFSTPQMFREVAYKFDSRLGNPSERILKMLYEGGTDSAHPKNVFSIEGTSVRLRVTHRGDHGEYEDLVRAVRLTRLTAKPTHRLIRRNVYEALENTSLRDVGHAIEEALSTAGY